MWDMAWVRLALAMHLAAVGIGRAAAMRHANHRALSYTAPPQTSDSVAKLSTYLHFLLTTLYTINPVSLPDTLALSLPWAEPLRLLGVALLAAGSVLFIWSHRTLAQFWTSNPGLRQGHRLIQTGPYAWMRHPMYTAFLLLDLGALLLIQNAVLLVPLVLWLAFRARAKREERLLARVFAHEYAAYRQATGMFAPRVQWRPVDAQAQTRPETPLLENADLAVVAEGHLVGFGLDGRAR
jgi:protein-S-isoprenylcysteine O-methyltransferase Ste14